jgi:N-acetylglucosaminyldiphosphoundecaprenol N-acetyl-beta-D-mannosaminyltransferase
VDLVTRVTILNASFDALTLSDTVDLVMETIHSGKRTYLTTVNIAVLMMMRADRRLQQFVDRSAFVVADGQPLVWASRLFAAPLPERVPGVDLVDAICEHAAVEGLGVYLLGARRHIVETVGVRLVEKYPGLRICGAMDGYFSPQEGILRARAVADSGAQILFVGMGVPRQEYFLEDHWDELGVNFATAVGGTFDVLAGLRVRAPGWVQRIGMEWFFRLAQEPRRLFVRYLTTNTQFLYLLCRSLLLRRRSRKW